MKVSHIMTTDIQTVRTNSTLEEAASIMKVENVGAVPVVDEDDDLVGIITDSDIVVRCVSEGKDPSETSVEEILSHQLETIEPDTDLEEAARLMADKQIRRLPVCEDGELVGMLSIGDVAVKTPDSVTSAMVLREISRGVKGAGARRRAASRAAPAIGTAHVGGSRASYTAVSNFRDEEDVELEFSDEKDVAASEVHERHANRRHQASQQAKGSGATKKKLHPISEGRPQRDLGSLGQKKEGQGISRKQADEELKRHKRVVAIRDQARAQRRPRKTG